MFLRFDRREKHGDEIREGVKLPRLCGTSVPAYLSGSTTRWRLRVHAPRVVSQIIRPDISSTFKSCHVIILSELGGVLCPSADCWI